MKTLQFYTANWCTACRTMKNFVQDVCKIEGCKLEIVDVSNGDVDGSGITQLPFFKVLNNKKEVERTASGAVPRCELQKFIRG